MQTNCYLSRNIIITQNRQSSMGKWYTNWFLKFCCRTAFSTIWNFNQLWPKCVRNAYECMCDLIHRQNGSHLVNGIKNTLTLWYVRCALKQNKFTMSRLMTNFTKIITHLSKFLPFHALKILYCLILFKNNF